MARGFSLFRSIQLGVLLAVMYYAFFFDDGASLKVETQKIQQDIVVKKKQLKKIMKEERELREYSALLDSLDGKVAGKILHILNSYSSGNKFAVFLADQAKDLDLFNSSVSRVVSSKEKKWEVQEVRVTLEAGYHKLMEFITNIQSASKIVIIRKAEASLSHSSGRLQISLTVKLYQFSQRDKSASRGKR